MNPLFKTLLGIGLFSAGLGVAHGAAWAPFAPTVGPKCSPIDINDSGNTVGVCRPASETANDIPWVADGATHGAQVALTSLASNQPCSVWGISNSGTVVGSCADASNALFAVIWNYLAPGASPVKLDALPATLLIPLLRPKDVRTVATAINDQGDIAGLSSNAAGDSTVVFFPSGSGTPERVSGWGDNCSAADINKPATGNPQIALNCPNSAGNSTAMVAEKVGGSYSTTTLTRPSGASFCNVNHINNASNFVGTCFYPNSAVNVARSVYWSSKTAVPLVLSLSSGSRNAAISVNEAGFVLVVQQTATGPNQFWVWLPSPLPVPIIVLVTPPSGSKWFSAGAIATGNVVGLNAVDSNQYLVGCSWTQAGGSICLPSIGGGHNSQVEAMSKNGSFMAGTGMDSAQNIVPLVTPLP